MLVGGLGLFVMSRLTSEPIPSPTRESWLVLIYLVVVGSVLAFTAYVTAFKNLPIQIVMTYTYVNPVIAVLLGSIILDEQITPWTLAGMVLVSEAGGVLSRPDGSELRILPGAIRAANSSALLRELHETLAEADES